MKTHRNLWDGFVSKDNFDLALARAIRGKKSKPEVARFMKNAADNLERIRVDVAAGRFRTGQYRVFRISDPKPRDIYCLPFAPDRIVHHALVNILGPIWQSVFSRDSYACIPGRGLHDASKRASEFVRRNKYVLQCDILRFYPSIPHENAKRVIRRKIGDKRILAILDGIIDSIGGGRNLPIGNYISQWLGNLYLNELDTFVKNVLRVRDYLRYSDDFCLFSDDKAQLAEWRDAVREFLDARLLLGFSKAEIFPARCGLDFVGYRHFPKLVLLRKKTARRIRRRMDGIRAACAKRRSGLPNARETGQIAAAKGWLKHASAHNLVKKIGGDLFLLLARLG